MDNLINKPTKRPWRNEYNSVHAAVMFLVAVVALIAFQFIIIGILDIIYHTTGNNFRNATVISLINLSFQIIFALVAILVSRGFKVRFRQGSYIKKCSSTTVLISIILTAVCFLFMMPMLLATIFFFEFVGFTPATSSLNIRWFHHVIFAINAIIFAGICEELVFRGGAMWGIKNDFGKITAILLSSLAFSIMHMNPLQTVHQFVLGAVMGYVAIEFKSMIPAIIIHALNNAFAVAMTHILPRILPATIMSQAEAPYFTTAENGLFTIIFLGVGLVSMAVGGLLVWVLVKAGKEADKIKDNVQAKKLASANIEGGIEQPMPVNDAGEQIVIFDTKEQKRQRKIIFWILFSIASALCMAMWMLTFVEGLIRVV